MKFQKKNLIKHFIKKHERSENLNLKIQIARLLRIWKVSTKKKFE